MTSYTVCVYFKTQIDLETVERIVQNFTTSTTPPVPPFSKQDAQAKLTDLHSDIKPFISGKSLENFKEYIKFRMRYEKK